MNSARTGKAIRRLLIAASVAALSWAVIGAAQPGADFVHHRRRDEAVSVQPKPLVIIEGLMVLYDKQIRDLLDLKLYVDTPDDIRFIRRLKRDIAERGRTVESVCNQYLEVVRPGHFNFIEPTKVFADIIIPEGGYNENALSVLIPFVKELSR